MRSPSRAWPELWATASTSARTPRRIPPKERGPQRRWRRRRRWRRPAKKVRRRAVPMRQVRRCRATSPSLSSIRRRRRRRQWRRRASRSASRGQGPALLSSTRERGVRRPSRPATRLTEEILCSLARAHAQQRACASLRAQAHRVECGVEWKCRSRPPTHVDECVCVCVRVCETRDLRLCTIR